MTDENLNIPQPDPSWEYYLIWHRLLKARFQLDKLIKFIGEVEEPNDESDKSINDEIYELVKLIEQTVA